MHYKEVEELGLENANFKDLIGKNVINVRGFESGSEKIIFKCDNGSEYFFTHLQDCCEIVEVDDCYGSSSLWSCLITKEPLIVSDMRENIDSKEIEPYEHQTMTFYTIDFENGAFVQFTFKGESNGYYSETVDVFKRCLQ